MHLSVVIPAYNEEKRIEDTLSRMYDYLRAKDFDYEVIVVDDGSSDDTVPRARESGLSREGKLKVVSNGENRGKGYSVKSGMAASSGDHVLICDADMSTPIEELDRLSAIAASGYDIVIGSRAVEGADVRVRQPWYRERMGKVFNFFVKLLLMSDFRDTQCGFKLFRGDAARDIAEDLKIEGFCFDVEMLYLAGKKGYKIREEGVVWDNSPQSKVRIMGSSLNMFLDLVRIKRLHG